MASDELLHTFGALYVGGVFTFILFGFATLQVYLYFYLYARDGLWKKLLVIFTWLTHTVQVGLLGHALYHYFVANFSNEAILGKGYWSLYAALALNLPISVIVQLFFTKRVYSLASTKPEWKYTKVWLTAFVLFLVVAGHLGAGAVLTVKTILLGRIDRLPELRDYVIATAAAHVASEIGITGSLSVLLIKSKTEFRRTNDLLHSLMVYAIHRSLFTSLLTAVGAVAFATNTDSLWFLALEFVICSAHLNSMLGALNDRAGLRAARSDAESVDVLRSGHSGSMPKAHLRSGSYVRAHLRGLSYGSASPPSTSSPLRTPPLNAGFTLPGGPAGVGKGGWPAPSYPPSSVSSIFVPTHQATEIPLAHVTVERETRSEVVYPQIEEPKTPTSNSPFMQSKFMAI